MCYQPCLGNEKDVREYMLGALEVSSWEMEMVITNY